MQDRHVEPLVSELKAMKQRMDALFMKSCGARGEEKRSPESTWQPQVDAMETGEAWLFVVDLPGVAEESLQLEVVDHTLKVSGDKSVDVAGLMGMDQGVKTIKRERCHGPFHRVLPIPRAAKEDAIQAQLKLGVLTIRIPKQQGAPASEHKITVQPL